MDKACCIVGGCKPDIDGWCNYHLNELLGIKLVKDTTNE